MPDPFEMLAQSDQSTARLFGAINERIQSASNAKIDLLQQQSQMGLNLLQLSQAQQRIELQKESLKHDQRMGIARLELDRGRTTFEMEQDLVKMRTADNALKLEAIDKKYTEKIQNALMIGDKETAMALSDEKLSMTERLGSNGIGDLSGLYESLEDTRASSALFPKGSAGTEGLPAKASDETEYFGNLPITNKYDGGIHVSAFGGSDDPVDNGTSGVTGRSNNEFAGVALPARVLRTLGISSKNARVRVDMADGSSHILPVAGHGTDESIWRSYGATLDFNPKAVAKLGGKVLTDKNGKMSGVKGLEVSSFEIIDGGNEAIPRAIPVDKPPLVEASIKAGQTSVELNNKFKFIETNEDYREYLDLAVSKGLDKPRLDMIDARIKAHSPFFKKLRKASLVSIAVNNDPNVSSTDSAYLDKVRETYIENGGDVTSFNEVANLWQAKNASAKSASEWRKAHDEVADTDPRAALLQDQYMTLALGSMEDVKFYNDELRRLVEMPPLPERPAAPVSTPEAPGFGGKDNPIVNRSREIDEARPYAEKLKSVAEETNPHKSDAIVNEVNRLLDNKVPVNQAIYDLSDEQVKKISKEAGNIKNHPTNRQPLSEDFTKTVNDIRNSFNDEPISENAGIETFVDLSNKFKNESFSLATLGEVLIASGMMEHKPTTGLSALNIGAGNYASSPNSEERRNISKKAKATLAETIKRSDPAEIKEMIAAMKAAIVVERIGSSKL